LLEARLATLKDPLPHPLLTHRLRDAGVQLIKKAANSRLFLNQALKLQTA